MLLPSDAAATQRALLESYPPLVREQIAAISKKLLILGTPALFTRILEGPVVRTFYFKPTEFSKFSAVLNKGEEIAGSLGVESVIITRELGEFAIAVPRADRQLIQFDHELHKMLTNPETKDMSLPLLMGQTPNGEHLYADLAAQPHMLIAGTTGSGKSVYTAQIISSLALFRTPEELEFVLVDTKNLDLVLFKGLEHVKYVLNNMQDLRAALMQLLDEVRLRNSEMSGLARNIREWNSLVPASKMMKFKILIVDELADVLMQDESSMRGLKKNERPPSIEDLLQQIAQISRAAGVHLILATQRPSVDVLPGRIKTNFPARIAFKLPSQQDSRVILDENGAESLLGRGDYLYKLTGSDTMRRAHSAFIATNDIAMILAQNEMIRRQYATAL